MATAVFLGFIVFSLYLAMRSNKGRGPQSVHDFFVASRQFGAYLVFFLAAGEIYSIGTMVGFPGGIYAKGPTYGVWFLGYILLAYPVGYFIGPKIWQAGKRYNAITLPDLFKGHFESRALELIVAGSAILFLLPWGQLQFTGLVAALKGLGWDFQPLYLILISAALAFTYIAIAGVRASAYIAMLKDILMVAGDRGDGSRGGVGNRRHPGLSCGEPACQQQHERAPADVLDEHHAVPVARLLRDAVCGAELLHRQERQHDPPHAGRDAAVHADVSVSRHRVVLCDQPEPASRVAERGILCRRDPACCRAGCSDSSRPALRCPGLLVLAGICLAIGPIVTRNLLPQHARETSRKRARRWSSSIYLLVSIVMTLLTPNLMLTLINTTYYGVTQFFPGVMVILFGLRVRPAAIGAGMLTGQLLAIALYADADRLRRLQHRACLCLALNVVVATVVNLAVSHGRVHALS